MPLEVLISKNSLLGRLNSFKRSAYWVLVRISFKGFPVLESFRVYRGGVEALAKACIYIEKSPLKVALLVPASVERGRCFLPFRPIA